MSLRRFLLVLLVLAFPSVMTSLAPAQSMDVPKLEVFGGYSRYHAGGSVNSVQVPDFKTGWAGQLTFNTGRGVGIVLDANGHYNSYANANSFAVGPQFKWRVWHFVPFGEALLGFQDFSPKQLPSQNAATYTFGAGLDVRITPRLSVRPFQVDFINTYYNAVTASAQRNLFNGYREQAGMVYNFGLPAQVIPPVTAVCAATPPAVDAGAPVSIEVTAAGFLPKRTLRYLYTSSGGKTEGNSKTSSVDTAGVAPGIYTVTAKVVDNGKGTHQRTATCQAAFSVNQPPPARPPVLSATVGVPSVASGSSTPITVDASSADNRPLTTDCSASAGHLTGSGSTYTLDTTGVSDGNVTVTCTVSDDRKLSATTTTSVKVELPVQAQKSVDSNKPSELKPSDFGTIEFKRDKKRPTRVDNEAKGELDRFADALAAAPDSKSVVVGTATAEENGRADKATPEIAAQRAVNTKDYLVKGKGIDAARVEARSGSDSEQKVELWIVPAGATFSEVNTKLVNEAKVKAVPRVPLKVRRTAHKKGHKASHKG